MVLEKLGFPLSCGRAGEEDRFQQGTQSPNFPAEAVSVDAFSLLCTGIPRQVESWRMGLRVGRRACVGWRACV